MSAGFPPLPPASDVAPLTEVKEGQDGDPLALPKPPTAEDILNEECPDKENVGSHIIFVAPGAGTPAAAALAANEGLKISKMDKIMSKFRGLKRPKIKSLNVLKQLKKHTKLRRKAHKNFKGKVIDGQHELYVMTAGIMLGMKCSLSHGQETEAEDDGMLTLDSFNYVEKASFPAIGSDDEPYPTPPHSLVRTFKFKSYAPRVFARLRSLCDISTDGYMESICGNYNFLEFMSNSKSGQFFFYSHDGKYMLKTQTKEENKFYKCILPHYYRYLAENPHSLLVRILGMHRVKMYQFRRKVHFVIMTSVFDTPEKIHTIYDLKGSLVGRGATPSEKANGGVLKDLDLLDRTQNETNPQKIHLGAKKELFMAQAEKDAKFLASLGIMDYSLLLGIHNRDKREEKKPGGDDSVISTDDMEGPQTDTPMTRASRAYRASVDLEEKEQYLESVLEEREQPPSPDATECSSPTSEVILKGEMPQSPLPPLSSLSISNHVTPVNGNNTVLNAAEESGDNDDEDVGSIASLVSGNSSWAEDSETESLNPEDVGDDDDDDDDNSVNGIDKDAALLLNRRIAYSDTNGLRYPEGNRLSLILSDRGAPSPSYAASPLSRSRANSSESDSGTRISSSSAAAMATLNEEETSSKRRPMSLSTAMGGTSIGALESTAVADQAAVAAAEQEQSARAFFGNHPWTSRSDGGINSRLAGGVRGNEIYYCGVIDILQKYNMWKQSESVFKGVAGWDTDKISAVNPDRYAARFVQFLKENID